MSPSDHLRASVESSASVAGHCFVDTVTWLYVRGCCCYKSNITQWDADKAEFWDTALKGSSCLRAALCRALKVEVATAQGFASVGLLWDLAAFFDSIRLPKLMKVALEKEFLPWILSLAMQVYSGVRAF